MKECIFILVVFFANVVEGITGFAGTMLAMPVSMRLLGVNEAKIVLNIVAIIVSLSIAVRNYRDIDWKQVLKISLFMVIGMMGGMYLFSILPVKILETIYGVLIIMVALRGLFIKKEMKLPQGAMIYVILLAGVIHGMFLSGGALLVIYAVIALRDKAVIRATLAPVWIILNIIMLIKDFTAGVITGDILCLAGYCIFPVILALILGEIFHKRINQTFFVRLTYILLIFSGGFLLT